MHQPKAGSRLSAYTATSQNSRRSIAESNRENKVIVGIGWRVVVMTFTLNCMHMQAVVHVMQAVVYVMQAVVHVMQAVVHVMQAVTRFALLQQQ